MLSSSHATLLAFRAYPNNIFLAMGPLLILFLFFPFQLIYPYSGFTPLSNPYFLRILHLTCLRYITPTSASIFTWTSPICFSISKFPSFYENTSHTVLRVHSSPVESPLSGSSKPYYKIGCIMPPKYSFPSGIWLWPYSEIGFCIYKSQRTKDCWQPPESRKMRKVSSQTLLMEHSPLTPWFSTSILKDCERIKSCFLKQFVAICYSYS